MSLQKFFCLSDETLATTTLNGGYTLGQIERSAIVDEDAWLAALVLAGRIRAARNVKRKAAKKRRAK